MGLKRHGSYRKSKRSRRGRRRSFRGLVSFICFVMILAAIVSAAVIFFKIGSVEVIGDTKYTDQQIISASGITTGQSMFLFNKFASISSIFAECPYIDEIQMRRSLPDVIQIIVTPCTPTAVIESTDGSYIIDMKGKILEKTGISEASGLPVVRGGQFDTPEIGKYVVFSEEESSKALFSVLNTAKNSDILENISDIDITKVYDIKFKYLGRFIVEIGSVDDIERKFKFADAVVGSLGDNDMGIIDVSSGQTGYFTQDRTI